MRPIIARAGIMVLFCALLAVSCAKKDDPITDSTGPTISNVVTVIAAPNATISWLTNEAATSQVDYCNTSAFGWGTNANDASFASTHALSFNPDGWSAGTTIYYRIVSADRAGNSTTDTTRQFLKSW